MGKSRLKEKLGHHWGSGEVSTVWPPVLFYCLVRLVRVCDSTGSTLYRHWNTSCTGRREITGELQGGLHVGERRPSDRLLCWGGMDVLKHLGPRPNVRRSVDIVRNISEFFGIFHVCMRVLVCWFACLCRWLTTGKKAGDRWVRSVYVGVFVLPCGCKE